MAYRHEDFAPGEIYHIYSRGIERRKIFLSDQERIRFLDLLLHCMPVGKVISYSTARKLKRKPEKPKQGEGLVDLLCYCLMNNHFHLLVRENTEGGTSAYMQRLLNSYAKYFNMRHQRSGSLFLRPFHAVLIDGDDQFIHVTRYIHLNPYVAHISNDPFLYQWSSLVEYIQPVQTICHTSLLHGMMTPQKYRQFVADESTYARELADIQHLLLDNDEIAT